MKLELHEGRFLEHRDVDTSDNVCVLSYELAKTLRPLDSALGIIVQIRSTPYRVVGVMKRRGIMASIGSSLESQDFSDDVYAPITTFGAVLVIGRWKLAQVPGQMKWWN